MTQTDSSTGERADLVAALERQRWFLRNAVRGLTDEQAAQRSTASELTLAGLIKHVAAAERQWSSFIVQGASAMGAFDDEQAMTAWMNGFQMMGDETVQLLLEAYEDVARRTNELILSSPDLDAGQRLPEAPWFEQGASWSVRRVVLHLLAEIAQHAGHADIIRESLDGSKSMG